jgi:hypothetical protein
VLLYHLRLFLLIRHPYGVHSCTHYQWVWCAGIKGNPRCEVRAFSLLVHNSTKISHLMRMDMQYLNCRGPTAIAAAPSTSRRLPSGSIPCIRPKRSQCSYPLPPFRAWPSERRFSVKRAPQRKLLLIQELRIGKICTSSN